MKTPATSKQRRQPLGGQQEEGWSISDFAFAFLSDSIRTRYSYASSALVYSYFFFLLTRVEVEELGYRPVFVLQHYSRVKLSDFDVLKLITYLLTITYWTSYLLTRFNGLLTLTKHTFFCSGECADAEEVCRSTCTCKTKPFFRRNLVYLIYIRSAYVTSLERSQA